MELPFLHFQSASCTLPRSLVAVHGLLGSAMNWQTICTKMTKDHPVLRSAIQHAFVPSMRNHRDSVMHPKFSIPAVATDVEHFVRTRYHAYPYASDHKDPHEMHHHHSEPHHIDPSPSSSPAAASPHEIILVAHSMGGISAQHSLIRHYNRAFYRYVLDVLSGKDEQHPVVAPLSKWLSMDISKEILEALEETDRLSMRFHPIPFYPPITTEQQETMISSSLPSSHHHPKCTQSIVKAVVIVDCAPITKRPPIFSQVEHDVDAMLSLPLTDGTIQSHSDADRLLERKVHSRILRSFLLTNLGIRENNDANNSEIKKIGYWKSNLPLLRKSIPGVLLPDPFLDLQAQLQDSHHGTTTIDRSPFSFRKVPSTNGHAGVEKGKVPLMYIFGGQSKYYQFLRSIRDQTGVDPIGFHFEQWKEVVVPSAGHFLHHENMTEFLDILGEFISEVYPRKTEVSP